MLASFEDGTKTMVEITSIANAIGFEPEIRERMVRQSQFKICQKCFPPKKLVEFLSGTKIVDYAVGPAPGVFVIITTDREKIIRDLNYLSLSGHNGFWCLYRPYHLANLETPISIANAMLDGLSTLVCLRSSTAETITVAKRDLKKGEKFNALGGFTVLWHDRKILLGSRAESAALGLAVGAMLKNDVSLGEAFSYDDVDLDDTQLIVELKKKQDELLASG